MRCQVWSRLTVGFGLTVCIATACTAPSPPAAELSACSYVAKEPAEGEELAELESHADCASIVDGQLSIEPDHLKAIDFGSDDYTSLWAKGEWYYIQQDGTAMQAIGWDNGPDPFSEGLARTRRDGKIAYFDESFQIVIAAKYDFGWPFEEGRALVCLGCGPEAEPDGEHTAIVGGLWGYIDRKGVEVVPVRFSRDEADGELAAGDP